jgi:lipid II:glycine glycyltransferase (peptidoglycan interpeptide bridge formation enzyme)
MSLCVKTDKECIYLFSWKDKEAKHEGAGAFGLWSCILEAKKSGCTVFDFAGSDFQAIERFFRGFGGALTPLIQLKKVTSLGKLALKLKK